MVNCLCSDDVWVNGAFSISSFCDSFSSMNRRSAIWIGLGAYLAVAYVRLKEFTKADDLLNKALQQNPKHYYTLSNLGVSAKKTR